MVRHGARVKITEERLEQVEALLRAPRRHDDPDRPLHRPRARDRAVHRRRRRACRCASSCPTTSLGAGLWATTFCVLGYVFWRSFDQLTAWVSRGPVRVRARRRADRRDRLPRPAASATRSCSARTQRVDRRAAREAAAAPGRAVRCAPAWQRVVRPAARRLRGARRGSSGTASRRATSGSRSRRCWRSPARRLVRVRPARRRGSTSATCSPVDRARRPTSPTGSTPSWSSDVAEVGHGARLVPGRRRSSSLATAVWAVARRRYLDAAVLVGRRSLVDLARRRRRQGGARPPAARRTRSSTPPARRIPSGHAAYAVAWVACAVVLVRGGQRARGALRAS